MISIMYWWTSEQVCIEYAVPVALLPGMAIRGMLFLLRALLEGNVARNMRQWRRAGMNGGIVLLLEGAPFVLDLNRRRDLSRKG